MSLSNDDIKQLINILQKALIEDDNNAEDAGPESEQSQQKQSKTHKPVAGSKKNKKVANTTGKTYNKFESMPEKNMHKDDTRIDKILSQYSPTQRSREFSLINVTCRVCGRQDEINPALIYDSGSRYKCNRCSKVPG